MAMGDVNQMTIVGYNGISFKPFTNHLYFRQDAVVGPSPAAWAADVLNWWNTAYTGGVAMKTLYQAPITLTAVEVRTVYPSLSPTPSIVTTGFPVAGTAGTDAYDPAAAVVCSLRTASIGRSNRGRIYLPAFCEGSLNQGVVPPALAATVAIQLAGLLDAIKAEVGSNTPVIFSKKHSTSTNITQVKVDETVRTQRRRNPRAPVYGTAAPV
jgi:hypothetical protein